MMRLSSNTHNLTAIFFVKTMILFFRMAYDYELIIKIYTNMTNENQKHEQIHTRTQSVTTAGTCISMSHDPPVAIDNQSVSSVWLTLESACLYSGSRCSFPFRCCASQRKPC